MGSRGLSRRQFLRRAGGGAGVVAVGLGGSTALHHAQAQHLAPDEAAQVSMPGHDGTSRAPAAHPAALAEERPDAQYAFFNEDQADTIAAIAERLWPGAPGKPGARDADVLNYIDLALAGAYLDLQDFYRRGLQALDDYAEAEHGQAFSRLAPEAQDDVLRAVERGTASTFSWPTGQAFFNTLWTHTIEGMFADPVYGGNRDFAGWRLIEFDGAQPRYLRSDMQTDAKFTRAPILGLKQQYEEGAASGRSSRAGGE